MFGYFNLGLGNTYCGADGLVTGGFYRFSRNPQYTASIIGLVGLSIGANSLLTANAFIAATSIVAFLLVVLRTPREEARLIERFGDSYREYMRRRRRLIPGIW